MSLLFVVFGAGQIGAPLATRLLAAGHRVRQVTRSGTAVPGAESVAADASDPQQAIAACAGADVVVQTVNAPCTKWATMLLPLQAGIIAGAEAAGARLVVLDNLYCYGVPEGPIHGDSPLDPCSRKGRLRQQAHELLMAAVGRGLRVAVGRASDFVGPGIGDAILSESTLRGVATGGRAPLPGDGDLPRGYSWGPDVVDGLFALATDAEASGVWMLPTINTTTRELLQAIAGDRKLKTMPVPKWLLNAVGLVVPLVRELAEMAYQWEVPYTVDARPMAERYGLTASSLDAVAAWARGDGEAVAA
jgi:nucleoside-diphosphate-sugar epimerase